MWKRERSNWFKLAAWNNEYKRLHFALLFDVYFFIFCGNVFGTVSKYSIFLKRRQLTIETCPAYYQVTQIRHTFGCTCVFLMHFYVTHLLIKFLPMRFHASSFFSVVKSTSTECTPELPVNIWNHVACTQHMMHGKSANELSKTVPNVKWSSANKSSQFAEKHWIYWLRKRKY